MSKIAIISQADQGVLINVGGCVSLQEATHHLTSTLQISSEFWTGMNVELNLGQLELNESEVAQILSIAAEVGIKPSVVFAQNESTRQALMAQNIALGSGKPLTLPVGPMAVEDDAPQAPAGEEQSSASTESGDATVSGTEQSPPAKAAAPAVLYLRQTLRSGQSVSHMGHLVIVGDVNPGAEVIAEGDITVWGALRGIAHAGINGNTQAEIRALRLEPIQVRIAHAIARSPDRPKKSSGRVGPETARVVNGTIRIVANNPD